MPDHPPVAFGLLEHTADIGIWLESTDISTLFSSLPDTLAQVMVSGHRSKPSERRKVEISGPSLDILFADLASEVVYLLDAEGLIVTNCDIIILKDTLLTANITVCPFNSAAHQIVLPAKAVTYHQASVKPSPAGWRGELYLDV
jgi:SHS2 domain-containing protein